MKYNGRGDDSIIVEGCINKDLSAWSALVAKYSRLISASIANRAGKYGFRLPGQDIEDIKQDFLASLWKGGLLKTVRNRGNISYWLAIAAGNMAVEYLRARRGTDEAQPISLSGDIDDYKLEELLGAGQPCPSEELAREELAAHIQSGIEALPSKERLLIKLDLIYDKKQHEIAAILNMPAGTVASYIKRAKEKLKKKLQEFR